MFGLVKLSKKNFYMVWDHTLTFVLSVKHNQWSILIFLLHFFKAYRSKF